MPDTKVNIQTNGEMETDVPSSTKVKLHQILTKAEIDDLIDAKQKELALTKAEAKEALKTSK